MSIPFIFEEFLEVQLNKDGYRNFNFRAYRNDEDGISFMISAEPEDPNEIPTTREYDVFYDTVTPLQEE